MYTDNCLSILSERTVWFLTVAKALIGDQREYSLLAGLWVVKLFLVLLGFLSLSFKNDSKKSATKIISQGTAKLVNLIQIVQQSME